MGGYLIAMSETARKFELLFNPRSLALIGASASPYKWGAVILSHIINGGFKGKIYPVNPREKEIQGLAAYPGVEALPEVPDLAVVVTPPSSVPAVLEDCGRKGIKAGVIVTAGFAEVGVDGEKLEQEMVRIARREGIVLVGPNCFGIISTACKLFSIMPPLFPLPGPFAIVSQSGNVASSVASKLISKDLGISKLISSGNEADLHCEDYLEYLAGDRDTKIILSYIEGFRDGRRFFEVAKRVTPIKPIVMLKAGYTAAGAKAAKSHTASLAGSDAVFASACKQAGIIRVRDMDELFNVGTALLCLPLPRGKRVAILTAGGGWGVLGADACAAAGLNVVPLPRETMTELNALLPPWWSHGNPVDLVAGVFQEKVLKTVEVLLRCTSVDSLMLLNLVPALPQNIVLGADKSSLSGEDVRTLDDALSEVLARLAAMVKEHHKPIILAWEFGFELIDARLREISYQQGIPCYPLPDHATAVLSSLARYAEYRANLNPASTPQA